MHNSKEDRQQRDKNDKFTTNFYKILKLIMVAPLLQNKNMNKVLYRLLYID